MCRLFVTLLSPRFDRYVSRERREALLLRLAPIVQVVPVVQQIRECRNPNDDKFLEAAINGRAGLSGDADLVHMHPFRGVSILTPGDYLQSA